MSKYSLVPRSKGGEENKIGIIVLDPVNSRNKTLEELIISTQFGCARAVNLTKIIYII